MGTSIPKRVIELKGTNRPGKVKEYKLTPEELAKLAPAKPIPKSHHKPIELRPGKKTEEKKHEAVFATASNRGEERKTNCKEIGVNQLKGM